jgi:hypothetical protein
MSHISNDPASAPYQPWHGMTILTLCKNGKVVIAGEDQSGRDRRRARTRGDAEGRIARLGRKLRDQRNGSASAAPNSTHPCLRVST